jgi:AcrR family transcriptional regulator
MLDKQPPTDVPLRIPLRYRVMTTTKPNKHELRTRETRELLLRAAEEIFVRDGYAGAELGEIAKLAGRTKGAIYAQFKSKEDVFLALVEQHTFRYKAEMEDALGRSTGIEQNREALRQFYLRLSEDESWNILMLEFKLFAIRHPAAKKRLQRFVAKLISSDSEKCLSEILGPAGSGRKDVKRSQAIQALQPVLSGLCLEERFDDQLGGEVRKRVVNLIFDALF